MPHAGLMIGGMVSSTVLTLVVIPAVYGLIKGWRLPNGAAADDIRHQLVVGGMVGLPHGVLLAPNVTLTSPVPLTDGRSHPE